MTINIISLGTPMILMGDEVAHTQSGNNNGYCQDNADFWFNWDNIKKNKDLFRFTKMLIAQRKKLATVHFNDNKRASLTEIIKEEGTTTWHGVKIGNPDWAEHDSAIALVSKHSDDDDGHVTYMAFNAYWEDLSFELPVPPNGKWYRILDTSLKSGQDILLEKDRVAVKGKDYLVAARSIVILFG